MIKLEDMIEVKNCFWCKSTKFKVIAKRKDGVRVQECQSCHLIQVADIPEDLSVYYVNEDYFNPDGDTETGYHENYDLLPPFYLYWQGLLLNEVAEYSKKLSLLEVGCATGNAMEMVNIVNPSIEVEGIDLSDYAIKVASEKGLKATVSTIENFKTNKKFGLVFSSETMEHVDNLATFIDGVKNNLEEDGVFIFYVPAVNREDLIKQGPEYPSLTTSLEHVSYFTEEFLNKALAKGLDGKVYVHQISTNGENYHLGIVSKNTKAVDYVQQFIESFETYNDKLNNADTLYNLVATSAKFGRLELAQKYLSKLEAQKYLAQKIDFLKGIVSYSGGQLLESRKHFEDYLGEAPVSPFLLKIFLSVEKELNKIYEKEMNRAHALGSELEGRLFKAETELNDIKNSKIGKLAIRSRLLIGRMLNPARNQKKNL